MVTFEKPCNGFCVFICGGFDSKLRQSLFSSEIIFITKLLPKLGSLVNMRKSYLLTFRSYGEVGEMAK